MKIGKTVYTVRSVGKNAFKASKIRTVTLGSNVASIRQNAFTKSKVQKLILKTKKLRKKTVKGSLKNSKIKVIQVKLGSKKINKKYRGLYKKIFTKKIAGKKPSIK